MGPSRLSVDGKGVEGGFRPLQSVLAARSLIGVVGRVRSGSELCHGDRADRQLERELSGVKLFKTDDYGGVDEPTLGALGISHEGWGSEMQRYPAGAS